MKLKSLRLFNFITHKDSFIDFSKKGSYCIYSSDNGVGKSLLLDAIPWGLWGKTIRGSQADGIIGTFTPYTWVEQQWLDGDRLIKIIRYRKHSKFKNSVLIFFSKDEGKNWEEDSSKETRKDTDKFISNLFKMDYDLFISSVLITKPRSELNFCESKDTKRKEVLTNLLNLNWIASSLDRAKEHKNKLEKELQHEKAGKGLKIWEKENYEKMLKDLRNNSKDFKNDIEWQLMNLNKYNKSMKKVTLEMIKEGEEYLDNKKKSLIAFERKHEEFRKSLYNLEHKEKNYQILIKELKNKLSLLKDKMNNVWNNVTEGESCDHCGAEYIESNIKGLRDKLLDKKKSYMNDKNILENELLQIVRTINMKNLEFTDRRLKITKYEKELHELEERHIQFKRDRKEYKEHIKEKKHKEKLILETKNKKNPFIKKIKLVKKKYILSKQELAKISSRIILLKKKIKDTEYAIEAFGNSGIKNDIISTKIDLLEEKINYYLSKISNGNIYVQLDNKVQHGQNERIGIMIQDSKKTKPLDYNEWSGGEKTKIRFAVEWAINSILESNIDLLIVDEGFDFLSEIGIKAIMDVMKQETSKKIISVSNVTEMKEMFRNKILVELKDDCSQVKQF